MSSYKVVIYTPQELNHSSYVHTGLFELEHDGFLKSKVQLSLKSKSGTIKLINSQLIETNQPHPKTSFYKLIDKKNNKEIHFATDLYDASYSFSKYALDNCDFVFKRNYEQDKIDKLPLAYRHKIYPLGLTFPSVSLYNKSGTKMFWSLLLANLKISTKLDRLFFKRLFDCYKEQMQHWNQFKLTRNINSFEQFETNLEDYILFQTRCFPYETDVDVQQIHKQRYDLVLFLRAKFGDRFKGGIIPSPIAIQNYSESLSNLSSDPISYLNMVKKAKIVIYTRGLVNSPAWKMPEYLSQGKVIIAERLTAELPVSLNHGSEVLFFANEEELLSDINKALDDKTICDELSKKARKYFVENVHPKQNVKRIINFMLNHNT